ncbi:MAG: cupin domain-containing protein [Janthinobacterium lividum]
MPILHIANSLEAELANPNVPAFPLDGTTPTTLARDLNREDGFATGLWETTPGRFRRQSPKAEMMHVLVGSCTFTPDDGEPVVINAGDTVYFPAHTAGTWDVTSTLRKVFAVIG